MGNTPKKKRKLSAWNKFIRDNSHLAKFKLPSGSPDLTKMSEAFQGMKSTKSKPKKKITTGRVTTTTKKKETPKKRPKGEFERKVAKLKKEYDDLRRALGAKPKQSHFKRVGTLWSIKAGNVKARRVKLIDAMRDFRRRAKAML